MEAARTKKCRICFKVVKRGLRPWYLSSTAKALGFFHATCVFALIGVSS